MINHNVYDEDYFINGKQSGKSLYDNYRWMPDLTVPMARTIVKHLDISIDDTIVDYGCARGYLVKALRLLGCTAYGVDVSQWAIENADVEIEKYCHLVKDDPVEEWDDVDWVIAKDVLEHVEYVEQLILSLMDHTTKGVFAVVPLTQFDKFGKYVVEEYEKDITHIQRFTLAGWAKMFFRPGWKVECAYRLPGVKDNYRKYEYGNGFITCKRIFE